MIQPKYYVLKIGTCLSISLKHLFFFRKLRVAFHPLFKALHEIFRNNRYVLNVHIRASREINGYW